MLIGVGGSGESLQMLQLQMCSLLWNLSNFQHCCNDTSQLYDKPIQTVRFGGGGGVGRGLDVGLVAI